MAEEGWPTVRISVFADPRDSARALASVSESTAGASPWQAIDLSALKRPLNWPYHKLLHQLSKEEHSNVQASEVGRNLYGVFFTDPIERVIAAARAQSPNGRIRLAIDASADLVEIPWELLHDDNDFLSRQDCSIIRVARELPPGRAYFGPITQVGLIAVTPDFNAGAHLAQLQQRLAAIGVASAICLNPNRQELTDFLERERSIDALYFLGHGRQGQILLKPDGDSGWLDAGDLAEWLPAPEDAKRSRINLGYFSSCATAERRPEESVFSGVAQRLMLSGRVGTVVAMQAKIGINSAFRLAERFFEEVVRRGDPEAALSRARTFLQNIWARSIPVLYTHVEGPEAFRRNRLSLLLATKPGGKAGVSLPGFKMGLKYDDYERIKAPLFNVIGQTYNYRGSAYAQSDVNAAKEVLELLTEVGELTNVTIDDDAGLPDLPVTFYFGSGSHERIGSLLKEYATQFKPEFGDETWRINDLPNRLKYEIPSPSRHAAAYYENEDWGFIEKALSNGRCYFFLCGLGDRATRGCAYYLARNWQALLDRHLDRPFAELLRFPGGLDHTRGESVDRNANRWGKAL